MGLERLWVLLSARLLLAPRRGLVLRSRPAVRKGSTHSPRQGARASVLGNGDRRQILPLPVSESEVGWGLSEHSGSFPCLSGLGAEMRASWAEC